MLVCPNCRGENTEEARFCQRCGRSLEPQSVGLRGTAEKERPDEDLDISPPKAPSAWPGITALVLVVVALAGWGLWYFLKPDPCQGKYNSALFAYCAELPAGWSGGSQLAAEANQDEFTAMGGAAVTQVRVGQVIDPGTATSQYAQQYRSNQEANGLDPMTAQSVDIDGEQAIGWDIEPLEDEDGSLLRVRTVVLVREDGVWRITLFAEGESYEAARLAFEDMLASWHWK